MNELVQHPYVLIWERIFIHVLGWSREQIDQFVNKWKDDLLNETSIFYHEDPVYYAMFEIIPVPLMKKIESINKDEWPTKERWEIFQRIQFMIANTYLHLYSRKATWTRENIDTVDWLRVREEVQDILSEYGYSLPNT